MAELNETEKIELMDPELQMLLNNDESGYNYRYRRIPDWDENYELYRDNVQINRLTQRQSVNIPMMKGQIRSLLKDVDDMPVIYFENLDNDKQAEIFKNEYWKWTLDTNKMELQDVVDKKQDLLFGRTYDQMQIVDGMVKITVQSPYDIKVARHTDPFNIDSSRFLIHDNIFVPLASLKNNPNYNQAMVKELEMYYATEYGQVKVEENNESLRDKNEIMRVMGVDDVDDPVLGETYVGLALHFVYREGRIEKDKNLTEPEIWLYVVAERMKILMKKPLEEVIGTTVDHFWRNHYPYNSWADDLERQDWYSDAAGDVIRGPNKIGNAWWSQKVENRTFRTFGMKYYNSNLENFTPQTMEPVPWGWYGIPVPPNGTLDSVMKNVEVPELTDTYQDLEFLIGFTEKATGATSGQQGVPSERQITLGEFQATLTEAKEKVKGLSKFYTQVWKERALKFDKLCEAAPDKLNAIKIYKKGLNTDKVYEREIRPENWYSKAGYRVKVWSRDEKDTADINSLQKQNAVKQAMPNNPKVTDIYNRKLLEWGDYTPDEINEIMQWEQEQREKFMQALMAAQQMAQQGMQIPGMPSNMLPAGNPGGMGGAKPVAKTPARV